MIVLLRRLGDDAIGHAIAKSLAWRGHRVATEPLDAAGGVALHTGTDADVVVDTTPAAPPAAEAERLQAAAAAGIRRVIRVVADGRGASGYTAHEFEGVDVAIVRPTLVIGPRTEGDRQLVAAARGGADAVAGRDAQRLQPIHVFELAEAVAALVERTGKAGGDYELGGRDVVTLAEAIAGYRRALGLDVDPASGLPACDAAPFGHADRTSSRNAATVLLGRPPSTFAEALAVTPPARGNGSGTDGGPSMQRAAGRQPAATT